MKRIAMLGTGTMSTGIAQIAAQTDHDVIFWNPREESLELGLAALRKDLERLLKKERITQADHDTRLERIRGVTTLHDVKTADIVLESVPEDFELKCELFERLSELCADDVIFASNTSSLSITRLARASGRPELFIGMHFFNPVRAMRLVEIVRGLETSDATVAKVTALAEKLGKVPVEVKDLPGFAVNRLIMPMINEAAYALMQSVAEAKDIDECMKLGCNHPMGPLALADLVGLDIVYAILDTLHHEFGQAHYKPCPLIRKYVEAGWLGTKTGRGFYRY
jgi:3-hydroxybutyryl-CoA dehydrogenase